VTGFDGAERIADSVLYEGYVLYPYRASSTKNRLRWQFGVIAPKAPTESAEPWFSQTECLARCDIGVGQDIRAERKPLRLFVRVRCLRPHGGAGEWLEGVPRTHDLEPVCLGALPLARDFPLDIDSLAAAIVVRAHEDAGFVRIHLRLENLEPWNAAMDADRDVMLRHSLVGAHLLLAIEGGEWISLLEPPDAAAAPVAACRNIHTWPVLVGPRAPSTLMLSSPIILYDYPRVADESQCDLCDAAEIDEILSLRILTMTDEEKAEARATDPKSRAILDKVEAMSPEALAELHGAMRNTEFFNPPGAPAPEEACVVIADVNVSKGSHVRLHPNRRADAMDMFFRDQAATVAGVYRDVDERVHVAVTIDADPAAVMHESFGRYFYFDPEEVEPIEAVPGENEMNNGARI
jgi:hypothetical protein